MRKNSTQQSALSSQPKLTHRQMVLAELSLSRAVKHLAQQYGQVIDERIGILISDPNCEAVRILCGLRDELRLALWINQGEQPAAASEELSA